MRIKWIEIIRESEGLGFEEFENWVNRYLELLVIVMILLGIGLTYLVKHNSVDSEPKVYIVMAVFFGGFMIFFSLWEALDIAKRKSKSKN